MSLFSVKSGHGFCSLEISITVTTVHSHLVNTSHHGKSVIMDSTVVEKKDNY